MMITTSHQSARPCLSLFLLSLYLLAAFANARPPPPPPPPAYPGGPPVYHVYWDLRTEAFEVVRQRVREKLLSYAGTYPYFPVSLSNAQVLGRRRLAHRDAPPAWIHIHVKVGDAPGEQVTLIMAIDDVCILGFITGSGVWYKFNGGEGDTFKGFPPRTHELKTRDNYRDLIDGGHLSLPKVPLGKDSASHATLLLASFDHRVSPDEAQAQDGLIRFVVMLGEGMRLRRIRETFSGDNWEKQTYLSDDDARSVVDWGSSSVLVIRWFLTGGTWGGGLYEHVAEKVEKNSNIFGVVDAFDNRYDVWLRPRETTAELTS